MSRNALLPGLLLLAALPALGADAPDGGASLQRAVLDPIPEVRAVSGRTLGAIVTSLGVARVPHILPWLQETMQAEAGTVECSGGAQALVAVLVAMGDPRSATCCARCCRWRQTRARPASASGVKNALSRKIAVLAASTAVD